MSYSPYTPDTIQSMFFRWYNVKPYVYDPTTFTVMEMLGQAIEKINEVIKETNDISQAILVFENYVLENLKDYDIKIKNEVINKLQDFINDGTIANLINEAVFGEINEKIENLNNKNIENENNISNIEKDISDIYNDLNYIAPSLSLITQPSDTILELGEKINSVILSVDIIKQTLNLTKIEYYKNDNLIHTKNLTGNETQDFYIDENITTTSKYYCKLYDGKSIIKSNEKIFYFIKPFYIGDSNNLINETTVKSLNKSLQFRSSFIKIFSNNGTKIVISYPKDYGKLTNIIDQNNIEILESFNLSELTIKDKNNNDIQYYVYVSSTEKYLSNFLINFIFDGDTSIINQNLSISFNVNDDYTIDGGVY